MAGWTGLEPAASAVTGQRSNQLNYHPLRGIADLRLLSSDRIESVTTQSRVNNLHRLVGGRYRARTCDSRRVKPVLYQLS